MTTTTDAKVRRAHKRADGEGTIRHSENKKLWLARLMVGYRLDGKPDVREVSARTQKECKARLDALKAQANGGTIPSTTVAGLTVGAFIDRWLATVKPNLRERTTRLYRSYAETHLKPALGTKRLVKLSHDDITAFLNAKRDEKAARGTSTVEKTLAPRTVHHLYRTLATALGWGVKKGYLAINPMARVDPPRVEKVETVPLTSEQTATLLDTAETHRDPLHALWTLAALTGARKGELLGLTWDDVDLDAGTLRIRRSLARIENRRPIYNEPKTLRSRRTLDLDPDAVAALTAHRDRQAFARQALGDGYADLGIVFATERGRPREQGNVTRAFKRALKRAGLPPTTRMHDLRHGAATMLLEAGESVPAVSEYLGHATPAITMTVYAHAIPGASKRAAERLGSILRNARIAPEVPAEGDVAAS